MRQIRAVFDGNHVTARTRSDNAGRADDKDGLAVLLEARLLFG
jgi:hypothetical protein